MLFNLLLAMVLQASGPAATEATEMGAEIPAPSTPTENVEDASQGVVPEDEEIVVSGEVEKPEAMKCRYEKPIGSGIRKRVCRTESQMKAEAEAGSMTARDMAADRQRRNASALNGN